MYGCFLGSPEGRRGGESKDYRFSCKDIASAVVYLEKLLNWLIHSSSETSQIHIA